jgi:GAF domain-containing protein/HAMP domain-containing protein
MRSQLIAAIILLVLVSVLITSAATVSLVLVQYQREGLSILPTTLLASVLLAAAVVLLAWLVGLVVTRRITRPWRELADTAAQMAAGDLNLRAKVEREDEVGRLAQSINQLTSQLNQLNSEHNESLAKQTAELEKRSNQFRLATQVIREIGQLNDLDELLTRAALLVQDRFDFYHAGIYLLDERGEFAILKSTAGAAGPELLQQGYRQKDDEAGLIGIAASSRQACSAFKRDGETRYFDNPLLPDSQSRAVLPLRIGERVAGLLDLHSTREDDFEADTVEILQSLADQLAVAVDKVHLLGEMQESVRKLEAAYGEYTAGTWQSFVQRTRRLRGLRYRGLKAEPPSGMTAEALEALQGQRTILGERQTEPGSETLRNTLAIPMKLRGQTLGVVNVEFEGYRPTPETVTFYEEVTERLALALDNVRLIEETNLRSEQLKLLQEITAAAASHVNLEDLFEDITARIREGFEADHCGVILFDSTKHTGSLVASNATQQFSPTHHMLGTTLPLQGEPVFEKIIHSQKSSILYGTGDGTGEGPFRDLLKALGTTAQVFVPLASRGELLGVIMINVSDPERHFGEDDLLLMDQISLQITIAIEVARIFERIERRAQRERQIAQITSKVRASTNMDIILQTAVQELAEALDLPKGSIKLRDKIGSSHE